MATTSTQSTSMSWCKQRCWSHYPHQKIRTAHCRHQPGWHPCLSTSPFPLTHYTPSWMATIDVILASPWLYCHCNCSINSTIWISNHYARPSPNPCKSRYKTLFGNQPLPSHQLIQSRGVNSNAIPTVQCFCMIANKQWEHKAIPERVAQLTQKDKFTKSDHDVLEQINQDLTNILVQANWQCSKFKNTPWSPKLHQMYIKHQTKPCKQAAFKPAETMTTCWPSYTPNWA